MAGIAPWRDAVTVPCGSCLGCRKDQARAWAIRIVHESQIRPPAFFGTLTYKPEELPENGSLDREACQRFLKRLRKRSKSRVSYYLCGEYGEETDRPHYHSVFFGAKFLDRDRVTTRNNSPVWRSATLDASWQHGLTELTSMNFGAAMYVAGYVQKKVRQKEDPEFYTRVDPKTGELFSIEPEFALMSRRPAIGRDWLFKYWRDVYPRDFVTVDGRFYKPPRYYDKKMEEINPDIMEEVRYQRWKDAEEIGDEELILQEKVMRHRKRTMGGKRDAL